MPILSLSSCFYCCHCLAPILFLLVSSSSPSASASVSCYSRVDGYKKETRSYTVAESWPVVLQPDSEELCHFVHTLCSATKAKLHIPKSQREPLFLSLSCPSPAHPLPCYWPNLTILMASARRRPRRARLSGAKDYKSSFLGDGSTCTWSARPQQASPVLFHTYTKLKNVLDKQIDEAILCVCCLCLLRPVPASRVPTARSPSNVPDWAALISSSPPSWAGAGAAVAVAL